MLGVIPDALMSREATGTTHYGDQVVVGSMHDRKFKMYQASDGFVALPGGFGTLDELLEVLYVPVDFFFERSSLPNSKYS